jgi:S-adenosylmethionine synthetase
MSNLIYLTETKPEEDEANLLINIFKPEINLIKSNINYNNLKFKFMDPDTDIHYNIIIKKGTVDTCNFINISFDEIKKAVKADIKFSYLVLFDNNKKYVWNYKESDLIIEYSFNDIKNVRVLCSNLTPI